MCINVLAYFSLPGTVGYICIYIVCGIHTGKYIRKQRNKYTNKNSLHELDSGTCNNYTCMLICRAAYYK